MGEKPNVIIFVVDTLRADHLGCYGYFRETSPNIDRLAKEGVIFIDSHAAAIPTGPGFTSIITGLFPIHHHYYLTPWNIPNLIDFNDEIPTLPELIQDWIGGYTTAAFDNLVNFSSHMDHLVRGFEYYVNVSRTSKPVHHHLRGDRINERLIPWIKEHKDERFFIFVHYWDPHTPYNQPEEFREVFRHEPGRIDDLEVKSADAGYNYVPGWGKVGELWEPDPSSGKPTIDLYDGEIRFVDHLIGEVIETLEALNIEDNTLIIVTSDHGEQLGQHGLYDHRGLHESVVYVPLIMWAPSMLPSGKSVEGYVQHVDIAPTVLSLMGAAEDDLEMFDGVNLIPIIEGEKAARTEIFIENHAERAVISGKWKYIRRYFEGTEELYNLERDPVEVVNLAYEESDLKESLRNKLSSWVADGLSGDLDPMWLQVAKWAQSWAKRFGREFPDLKPRPTIIRGVEHHGPSRA